MFSVFLFLFSSMLCLLSAQCIPSTTTVYDIIHQNIPIVPYPYASDFFILIQTIGTATIINSVEFSELCLIMAIIQIFRAICSISTALPPLKNYHDKYRLGGINGSGTEYIFSGHASYSALTAIYLYNRNFNPILLIVYNLFSQSLIILTRNHYSVDVILAWIITPLLYGNIQLCKKTECLNILNKII